MNTTGGFNSSQLLSYKQVLILQVFEIIDAIQIGSIASTLGIQRTSPIVVEVRIGGLGCLSRQPSK